MRKNKNLVIFGTGDIAQLAYFYFKEDSNYNVVAFTVDREFIKEDRLFELPIIPFDCILDFFTPSDCDLFIAISYNQLNAVRRTKYFAVKELGFNLASYISSRAVVLTQIPIGNNCFILEHNVIQPYVFIGNNVTLWSGNHIGHHSSIKDHTFLASHIVVSGGVEIGEQCFIGVNSTIRDHLKIGAKCVIGAGSLILSDADENGIYSSPESSRSRVPSNRLKNI